MTYPLKNETYDLKPFVKWAGGKKGLLLELLKRVPENFNDYFEPFVGGGALFFEMKRLSLLDGKQVYLFDKNDELINTYKTIQETPQKLINTLSLFKKEHSKEFYYDTREMDRKAEFKKLPNEYRAARFIYLNKTCFNGLYRVNKKGFFNVPMGNYKNPQIYFEQLLLSVHEALQGVNIFHACYSQVVDFAKKGDFIYLDPPYHPINETSNFTSYHEDDFSTSDQEQLSVIFKKLSDVGCFVLQSNSDTDFIKNLYKKFVIEFVKADRHINCKANGRGKVSEVLVSNL